MYEPVALKVGKPADANDDTIYPYQQYGEKISVTCFCYTIGEEGWKLNHGNVTSLQRYRDLKDALVYNNFDIDLGMFDYFKRNPLPDDGVTPPPHLELPPVPKITSEEKPNRYYIVVQEKQNLENYSLYLLREDPVDYQVTDSDSLVRFLNNEGNEIIIRRFTYTVGDTAWKGSEMPRGIGIAVLNETTEYCNFDIRIESSNSVSRSSNSNNMVSEIPGNSFPNDGTGVTPIIRDKWVQVNGKWFYYDNGELQKEWITVEEGTIYLYGKSKWERLQSDWLLYAGYYYYFDENGYMVTGLQTIYNENEVAYQKCLFDRLGRLVAGGPTGYKIPYPQELGPNISENIEYQEQVPIDVFISLVERLEDAYLQYYKDLSIIGDGRQNVVKEILNLLRYYNYNPTHVADDEKYIWVAVLGPIDKSFYNYLCSTNNELIQELETYIDGSSEIKLKLFLDRNGGALDIAHLAATTLAYTYGVNFASVRWVGWAGDLMSLVTNIVEHVKANKNDVSTAQPAADAFLGSKPRNFNYADICVDADAIKLAKMIGDADCSEWHALSKILKDYYDNYSQDRMQYYLEDMSGVDATVKDIYDFLNKYLGNKENQLALRVITGMFNINKQIQEACWKAFAKYICAAIAGFYHNDWIKDYKS